MANHVSSPPPSQTSSSSEATRQRLLQQATRLFQEHGFAGTPIRQVFEQAGFTAPTIYHHFRGKDGLIVAVVAQWGEDQLAWMNQVLRRRATPQERLGRLFGELERRQRANDWRGSLAANAAAELEPSHPVHEVIAEHRGRVRNLFGALATEAGAAKPDDAARRLQVLWDGAMAGARMEHGHGPIRAARDTARLVLPDQ